MSKFELNREDITIEINEELFWELHEKLYSEELERKSQDPNRSKVFWNMDEICKRTGMDARLVKVNFFTDPTFERFKVKTKWYFPAKETEDYIRRWMDEQNRIKGVYEDEHSE